jgi:hypothetical protein
MEDWQKELERIKEGIKEIHNDAVDIVLTNYSGEFKQRVFNDAGSKNAKDNSLGLYKNKYYAKKKASLGREAVNINLSFSGELERSIKVVNIDDESALVVTPVEYVSSRFYKTASTDETKKTKTKKQAEPINTDTEKVSTYLDKHFGKIFEPTKEELESNNKLLEDTIDEKFNELIKK